MQKLPMRRLKTSPVKFLNINQLIKTKKIFRNTERFFDIKELEKILKTTT